MRSEGHVSRTKWIQCHQSLLGVFEEFGVVVDHDKLNLFDISVSEEIFLACAVCFVNASVIWLLPLLYTISLRDLTARASL